MSITSAIVMLIVVWSMVFFIVLPLRNVTQEEAGEVVPGTHKSAPANANVGGKARLTTLIAVPVWAVIMGVILSGWITIRDIDWFDRMSTPQSVQQSTD